MKLLQLLFVLSILVLGAGCSVTKEERADESPAFIEMKIADSLEASSTIHEAALRYALVAEHFPTSRFYQTAVRKAAFLYSSPLNQAIDDSASLYWLQVYTSLPVAKEEKEEVLSYIFLLKKVGTLQKHVDDLVLSSKKQTSDLAARANRIRDLEAQLHDLETQLKEAAGELKKLRDIDVKAYKRGVKK